MQIFLLILFLFAFGCVLGWVLEVFFRRFFSAKKWVNPGFMKGPWLPLYGSGVVVMFLMCFLFVGLMPSSMRFYNPLGGLFGRVEASGPTPYDLIPIACMWVGMVLLEFIAGIIFIKGFKVKLWDYTNMKGNIMGIICPVFSIIWLAVAVLFYYAIDPFLYVLSTNMHVYMFGGNGEAAHFGFIFSMGIIYGIMIYDFVVSAQMFKAIRKFATDSGITERYEEMKLKWAESIASAKKKLHIEEKEKVETESPLKAKIAEAIYIDPEKEKQKGASQNYDENGRPIKTE